MPKKLNYASAGVGSVAHLTWEVIRDGAGIDTVHVPYKGGGQAMGDIIAGHVDDQHGGGLGREALGRERKDQGAGGDRRPALAGAADVPTLQRSRRQDRERRSALLVSACSARKVFRSR